ENPYTRTTTISSISVKPPSRSPWSRRRSSCKNMVRLSRGWLSGTAPDGGGDPGEQPGPPTVCLLLAPGRAGDSGGTRRGTGGVLGVERPSTRARWDVLEVEARPG